MVRKMQVTKYYCDGCGKELLGGEDCAIGIGDNKDVDCCYECVERIFDTLRDKLTSSDIA